MTQSGPLVTPDMRKILFMRGFNSVSVLPPFGSIGHTYVYCKKKMPKRHVFQAIDAMHGLYRCLDATTQPQNLGHAFKPTSAKAETTLRCVHFSGILALPRPRKISPSLDLPHELSVERPSINLNR